MTSVVVVGGGASAHNFSLPCGARVASVSSGVYLAPHPHDHFFAIDSPGHFRGHIPGMAERIHTPRGKYVCGYDPMKLKIQPDPGMLVELMTKQTRWYAGWRDYPNVTPWDVVQDGPPSFVPDTTIGLAGQVNSFLFAIQALAHLGYRHLQFIGCDFLPPYCPRILDIVRSWMPLSADAGVIWTCLTENSSLADFMPVEVFA